jgi:hypothetical protein
MYISRKLCLETDLKYNLYSLIYIDGIRCQKPQKENMLQKKY